MDRRELRQRGVALFQKYRYGLLVFLAGLFLMLLPMGNKTQEIIPEEIRTPNLREEEDFETRLSQILSLVQGAGQVRVFLSLAEGEHTLYQTDEDLSTGDVRRETVLVTGADRAQNGLIMRIDPPVYQGAIILCQGADNAAVRLSITQAVANATGLGTDQISVLKMK